MSVSMEVENLSAEGIDGVQEIFNGKCVLITGVTGFLGKVLLEKLLRSCPGIEEICVLLRKKKESSPEARLASLLNQKVFDRLKEECPDAVKKIRLIPGDVTLANFGLESEDYKKVKNDVHIVFHCAANVRFDDEPKSTLEINLLGVKHGLDICRNMCKLEAFVHVSTAFSFCNHKHIDETVYPEPAQHYDIIEALESMTNEELKKLCDTVMRNRPSLYHFSKAMAEILIQNTAKGLPVVIVRPAIVTAAVAEPFPGWIDNYNGPTGFIAACGKGIVRTLLVKSKVNADWMPVDTACNTLIVAAYYTVLSRARQPVALEKLHGEPPIVNCVCPSSNLISWMKVTEICLPLLVKYPSITVYALPGGTVTSCRVRYAFCLIFSHYFPALLVDIATFLGKGQRMVSHYNRIHRVMDHMQHYTTNPYSFGHSNLDLLHNKMQPKDQELFPIHLNNLDWHEYMENYVLGVRRYFLNEKDETLPEARKKMMKIYYLWQSLKAASAIGVIYVCFKHNYLNFPRILKPFGIARSALLHIQCKMTKLF